MGSRALIPVRFRAAASMTVPGLSWWGFLVGKARLQGSSRLQGPLAAADLDG